MERGAVTAVAVVSGGMGNDREVVTRLLRCFVFVFVGSQLLGN